MHMHAHLLLVSVYLLLVSGCVRQLDSPRTACQYVLLVGVCKRNKAYLSARVVIHIYLLGQSHTVAYRMV